MSTHAIGRVVAALAACLTVPAGVYAAGETFGKDIAPILNRSCVVCHRPGEAAPMSLVGYENVRPWVRSIRQKVTLRQMPPWPGDPRRGLKFRNDSTLSQAEIDTLVKWIDAGAPMGRDAIPRAPLFAEGWQDPSGREPDYVLTLPTAYTVPATAGPKSGGMLNPTFYVKVPFDSDQWIRAVQAKPHQRGVVHYMDLNIVEFPDGAMPPGPVVQALGPSAQGSAREVDFLTANYRPGSGYESFPNGTARRVYAGANRYFQITMHYEPNGTTVEDRSTFGFWFTRTAPASEIVKAPVTAGVITADGREVFKGTAERTGGPTLRTKVYYPVVPAHTERFEVVSVQPITAPMTIYELMPHAHNRAIDFKYTVVYPDGREQVLLSVPRYDENWQFGYVLAEPLKLPAGAKIVVVAHYDNSVRNKTVKTPSEPGSDMFMPTMQYAVEVNSAVKTAGTPQR
jgi:hypothetical protein